MNEYEDEFEGLRRYQERNAVLFPSIESLRWYVRQHRGELVERGALIMHRGRLVIDSAAFKAVVRDIGKRQALPAGARRT